MVPLFTGRCRLGEKEIPEVILGLKLRLEQLLNERGDVERAEVAFHVHRLLEGGHGRQVSGIIFGVPVALRRSEHRRDSQGEENGTIIIDHDYRKSCLMESFRVKAVNFYSRKWYRYEHRHACRCWSELMVP